MSGKYIIYKSKELAKEYDIYNDNIRFIEKYLNGKRNGKGEEYVSNGKLIFPGNYLNGKRNGKEYYDNIVSFEREYLNGKKWKRKGYSLNDYIIYELKDGKRICKRI